MVSLCWGSSLETFLDWLRFIVNFFTVLFCSLTSYLIISRGIMPLFLSMPNSLFFAINLTSLFYPNALWDIIHDGYLNKTDHNKKVNFSFSLQLLQFNCFTTILFLLFSKFFTLLMIIMNQSIPYGQINF